MYELISLTYFQQASIIMLMQEMSPSNEAIVSALSVYSFLRSFSYSLRISPFDAETFVASLLTVDHNCLSDTIHLRLLQLLVENFGGFESTNNCNDYKLLDSFTWTEYLPIIFSNTKNYFLNLRGDAGKNHSRSEAADYYSRLSLSQLYETEISVITAILDTISCYSRKPIGYFDFDFADKVAILDCLITVLCVHNTIVDNFDRRESTFRRSRLVASTKLINSERADRTLMGNVCPDTLSASFSRAMAQERENIEEATAAAAARAVESLPLFVKGEDGCLEVCILCGLGGMFEVLSLSCASI